VTERYWLDLFTGPTWEEFLAHGATVSGFRERRENTARRIHPGDYFICYITHISRFIGILRVKSDFYRDTSPIWENEVFPVRFDVELLTKLEPRTAIPVLYLRDKLSMLKNIEPGQQWSGFFRGSPIEFKADDAKVIIEAIEKAARNPIARDFDEKKYWYHPKIYESAKKRDVLVPVSDKERVALSEQADEKITHEEMQWWRNCKKVWKRHSIQAKIEESIINLGVLCLERIRSIK